jgi:hypothetical protein
MATLEGMQPTKTPAATSAAPLLTPWMPGPHDPGDASVVVSVTEFLAHRRRELPAVAASGWRMRMGWYAMPGAVGLWLWSLPTSARSGSISVWASEDDLERFVGLPHHVDIMKRYGSRGTVRSTTWTADRFEPSVALDRARLWISRRPE